MALNESELKNFFDELVKASKELRSNRLIFKSEWIYDYPTQLLEISGKMLHNDYKILTGWNGYGIEDLNKLVELGLLSKIYESDEDPITFEKIIHFLIISQEEEYVNSIMDDILSYDYYIHLHDNKEFVLRILANSIIQENLSSLEVCQKDDWVKNEPVIKSFMNHYVTGWIDNNDKVDFNIINEIFVTGTTHKIIKSRNYAIEKHRGQLYGGYPYEVHLTAVVAVLLNFGVEISKDDTLISAAWLHDTLEDTDADESWIYANCGEEIRVIVELVSNQKDKSKTKKENKASTFKGISENQNAIIVKLADRIANVEFSLLNGTIDKLKKYKKEQSLINNIIAPNIETSIGKALYEHLVKLIK